MTQNQIAFARLHEERRHNQAVESETARNNMVVSSETNRHNLVTEGQTDRHYTDQARYWDTSNAINQSHYERMDSETQRHNLTTESISAFTASEQQRHNRETESLGWSNLAETSLHNRITESQTWSQLWETASHNAATELIAGINANIAQQNADSNAIQAAAAQLNSLSNQEKVQSEVDLNKTREQDIMNQITNRNINTGLNVIETGTEGLRDLSQVGSNVVNSITGIFDALHEIAILGFLS